MNYKGRVAQLLEAAPQTPSANENPAPTSLSLIDHVLKELTGPFRQGAAPADTMQANPVFFTNNTEFRFWRPHLHVDQLAYREVVMDNCYRLPGHFPPGFVAVDIGAHIGSFAYAALDRGAERVFCYEADPRNYAKLVENLREHQYGSRAKARHGAVWRSDVPAGRLSLAQFDDRNPNTNTGGGSVAFNFPGTFQVDALPFAEVLKQVGEAGCEKIDLLKMDCEGAEFPILYTVPSLAMVQAICMELHVNAEFVGPAHVSGRKNTEQGMTEFLIEQGFNVARKDGFPDRPYIFAERRST